MAIRGKPSVCFTEALWQEWRRAAPATVFAVVPAFGHLLPLEGPATCHGLLGEGLARALNPS